MTASSRRTARQRSTGGSARTSLGAGHTGDGPRGRRESPPLAPVLLIDRLAHAGTERQVLQLTSGMEKRGEAPVLVTFERPTDPTLAPPCRHEVVAFRSFRSPSLVPSLRRLRALIRETRATVVHAFFVDSTILAWLATRGLPVGFVASVRQVPYQRQPFKRLQLRLAYRGCDRVLVNARAVADAFLANHPVDRGRVVLIPNGIEIPDPRPAVDPRVRPLADRGPVVGIVANLNRPVKRVDVFLAAAAMVAQARPETSFVVVGGGELEPTLHRMAADLGIGERVLFTGRVPRPLHLVAGFTIGVLSSDLEGLPNAVLEYMALGLPTVATATGGIPELVVPGKTGLLVPPGDPGAMARAILELLSDPGRRTAMGERALRLARERHSPARALEAHLAVYRDVARSPREGSD